LGNELSFGTHQQKLPGLTFFFFEIKMQLYEIKLLFAWATQVLGDLIKKKIDLLFLPVSLISFWLIIGAPLI